MAEATAIRQPLVGGPPASVSSGLVLNDRYVLESEVGRGGMSCIFAARDIKLDRRVAIKFLAPGTHDDDELRRFEQEARAAGSLNHPNVLVVHDIGTHEGNPYIVSELLEGGTLREHLDGAPLVLERAIDYAAQLADGLAAAHERGIVHRDLKPENLFITRDGRLKILDFGIAKLMAHERSKPELKSPAQTQTGVVLGTMGYMSPEQVRGEHAEPRSDIFSAGAILYEMLSRKRAFEASSVVETAYAILNENPPELPEQVPDDLREVVWRCLEKKPEERFQSSGELGFDLRKLSTPVITPRARRWRGWPFATTAIVVLLIAFISVLSVGRWRERLLGSARRTDVPAAASKSRRSVAVLGFKNLSGRPEEAWFSSALSEMLTT
ncbi:MAG TPA: serine/threonine-protein kinase, partial [Myxococcaceae bacterium]|nr:serine/threonine-protein kinase [Myxococcaceae bacterium]